MSKNLVMTEILGAHGDNHEYRVETHGLTSIFYMRMNPEIRRMVDELGLRSSESGLVGGYVPNGDLPPTVVIHNDEKSHRLISALYNSGYSVRNSTHPTLENRTQQ